MVAAYIKEEAVLERMTGVHLPDDPGQGILLERGHILYLKPQWPYHFYSPWDQEHQEIAC